MLKGNETLLDSMLFAFGLEKGSSIFYTKAAEKIDEPRGKEFFLAMADVERGHMANIRLLYCGMENEACPITIEEFIESVPSPFVEGGRLLESALRELDVAFLDEADAVKIALKHEAEASAFYAKAAKRMQDSNARVLFSNLAEDEKKHMEELARKLKSLNAG